MPVVTVEAAGEQATAEYNDRHPAEWSEANPPWRITDPADVTKGFPANLSVTPLKAGTDLHARLASTVSAGRTVVGHPGGVLRLTRFQPYGTSGNPIYAFGFWSPNIQGVLGSGADKDVIEQGPNTLTAAQLDALSKMTTAQVSNLGMMRFDGSPTSPTYVAGVTFRAWDQQMLTSYAGTNSPKPVVPQPAPHSGVTFYGGSQPNPGIVAYCRFQGAGRAMTSSPPFEHGNLTSQYNSLTIRHCEFDGRRAPEIDPARPLRVGVVMGNNETSMVFEDCWFHDSNVSRYAVNDQNRNTFGTYIIRRCKAERITINQNRDPALHGGQSLGGWTNASCFGWEDVGGDIIVEDSIASVDNPSGVVAHFQLTSVSGRNPAGGHMKVTGTLCRNTAHTWLDGYPIYRIQPSTYWWTAGFDNTIEHYHPVTGVRLKSHVVPTTSAWPPAKATLDAAGISKDTHYLIRAA